MAHVQVETRGVRSVDEVNVSYDYGQLCHIDKTMTDGFVTRLDEWADRRRPAAKRGEPSPPRSDFGFTACELHAVFRKRPWRTEPVFHD